MSKFVLSAFADEAAIKLDRQMDILSEHDIQYIEMRYCNGRSILEHSIDEVKEIKKQMDDRNFKLSSVGSWIGKIELTDSFEEHMDMFKHTVEIAKIMETDYVRMFSFYMPMGEDPNNYHKYRNQVIDQCGKLVEGAEKMEITLLHENEKEIYGDNIERCTDLFTTLKSDRFKAVFDPANFVQCGVETYPKAYEALKDHIEYIHIKDALNATGEVVPAGQGDGKVAELLSQLKKDGYEGFLSLEPHLSDIGKVYGKELDGVEDIDELMAEAPRLFATAVNALKNILENI